MLFSILIANYNNAPYLKECFDSILKQTYREIEVVFIDDCSKDNSLEIFNNYKKDFHSFQYQKNTNNSGCGYTKHKTCELATGEIMGFLDPDDTLTLDAVELMVDAHKTKPKASLIYSTHYRCDELLQHPSLSEHTKALTGPSYLQSTLGSVSHFASFKKTSYLQSRGIDPEFNRAVDQSLYYALDEVGTFEFINKPLYLYRIHAGGISGTSDKYLRAKYWAIKAMSDSYTSRIKNGIQLNITKQELDQRKSNLNIKWIDYCASERNFKRMYCNLLNGFITHPTKHFLLKIKYIFYPLRSN